MLNNKKETRMKLNKMIILVASIGFSYNALATEQTAVIKDPNQQPVYQAFKNEVPDFGPYKVERSMSSVPTSIVNPADVVAKKGALSFVSGQKLQKIGKGAVVRNLLTGDLSTVTGNFILLLEDGTSANEIANAAGLNLVSVFPGTPIAVFSIPESGDLLTAFEQLKAIDGVLETKIEVAENMFKSN